MRSQENNVNAKQKLRKEKRSERRRYVVMSQQKKCKLGDLAVRERIVETMTVVLLEMMTDVLLEMTIVARLEMTNVVLLEMVPFEVAEEMMVGFAGETIAMRIEAANVSLSAMMIAGSSVMIGNPDETRFLVERKKLRTLGRNLRMMATMAGSQWFAARSEQSSWTAPLRFGFESNPNSDY